VQPEGEVLSRKKRLSFGGVRASPRARFQPSKRDGGINIRVGRHQTAAELLHLSEVVVDAALPKKRGGLIITESQS